MLSRRALRKHSSNLPFCKHESPLSQGGVLRYFSPTDWHAWSRIIDRGCRQLETIWLTRLWPWNQKDPHLCDPVRVMVTMLQAASLSYPKSSGWPTTDAVWVECDPVSLPSGDPLGTPQDDYSHHIAHYPVGLCASSPHGFSQGLALFEFFWLFCTFLLSVFNFSSMPISFFWLLLIFLHNPGTKIGPQKLASFPQIQNTHL